jgi:hypothetical protein
MKTFVIFLTLLFANHFGQGSSMKSEKHTDAENLGRQILATFQHRSVKEYYGLFPSLEELNGLMAAQPDVCAEIVGVATTDLAKTYKRRLIPSLVSAYIKAFEAGYERGIDWEDVAFVGAYEADTTDGAGTTSLVIEFMFDDKNYALIIEKIIMLDGEWKATQYIGLI